MSRSWRGSPRRTGRSTSLGYIVGIGLTFALFQHMVSGIRHFVLDTGAGYELKINRTGAC